MAREHMPIQIGLPSEAAWHMDHPATTCYVAFIAGNELPDPGEAFIAAGETFGTAPQDVKPLPIEESRVPWAFECRIRGRSQPLVVWCEEADPNHARDLGCPDARWTILVESILEEGRPVDDAALLAATAARTGGARTRILLNPDLGAIFPPHEIERSFLSKVPGEHLDERHLFRIEVDARDRVNGPFWLRTVGLHRLGRPELEMLEIEAGEMRAALELLDALAARLVGEDLPGAGVSFETGEGMPVALAPVDEVIATLAPGAPGGREQRTHQRPGPRAVVCAAEKKGAFRPVWMPPREVLAKLARGEAGILRAARVTEVEARLAKAEWPRFVAAFAARGAHPERVHLAKVAAEREAGVFDHAWIVVEDATDARVRGREAGDGGRAFDVAVASVSDWVVHGAVLPGRKDPVDIGPRAAWQLGASI